MTVDLFDFNHMVRCLAEFKVDCDPDPEDLSKGEFGWIFRGEKTGKFRFSRTGAGCHSRHQRDQQRDVGLLQLFDKEGSHGRCQYEPGSQLLDLLRLWGRLHREYSIYIYCMMTKNMKRLILTYKYSGIWVFSSFPLLAERVARHGCLAYLQNPKRGCHNSKLNLLTWNVSVWNF